MSNHTIVGVLLRAEIHRANGLATITLHLQQAHGPYVAQRPIVAMRSSGASDEAWQATVRLYASLRTGTRYTLRGAALPEAAP